MIRFGSLKKIRVLPWTLNPHRQSSNSASFVTKLFGNPAPIWAGLGIIGAFQYYRIRKRNEKEISLALEEGRLQKVDVNVSLKVRIYNSLPLESLSRFAGRISRLEIPQWARTYLYSMYCKGFGVNIEEAAITDLREYRTFNEFFRRRLKPGCRPITSEAFLVSPCDGKVLHCSPVGQDGQVEQVSN